MTTNRSTSGNVRLGAAGVAGKFGRWFIPSLFLLLLLAGFGVGNYKVARFCLGFKSFERMKEELTECLIPVKKPLALSSSGYQGRWASVPQDFVGKLGLTTESIADLPESHKDLIPFAEVARYNPYPPLLFELNANYAYDMKYFSLLYSGVDDKTHQVTIYSGEADTTPSIFVPKYPLRSGGDYFVSYWMLVSRGRKDSENGERGIVVDCVIWDSYEGGSYNGFEEIGINAALWAVELLMALVIAGLCWLRRSKSRIRG
jgi:hypothetical protein